MDSRNYWINRQTQLWKTQTKKDNQLANKLKKEYKKLNATLEKEIAFFYQKYGKEKVIDFRKTAEKLTNAEQEILFQNIDEFAVRFPKFAHFLPIRTNIYKLNRLEGLQMNLRLHLLRLGAIEQALYTDHLTESYTNGYMTTLKNLGQAEAFFQINEGALRFALENKWVDGKNYSDRIWTNKESLIKFLSNDLKDAMIRGETYNKTSRQLAKRMNTGFKSAKRLVWTESSFVLNQSNAQAFKDSGVKSYEICAVLDSRTSIICQSLNGEVFEFGKEVVGQNFPPFHSWCRTTIIPVIESLFNKAV